MSLTRNFFTLINCILVFSFWWIFRHLSIFPKEYVSIISKSPCKKWHVSLIINHLQNISRNCTNGFQDKVKLIRSQEFESERWFFSHDLSNSLDNIDPYFFAPLPDKTLSSQTQPLSKACSKTKKQLQIVCTRFTIDDIQEYF